MVGHAAMEYGYSLDFDYWRLGKPWFSERINGLSTHADHFSKATFVHQLPLNLYDFRCLARGMDNALLDSRV